MVYPQDTTTSLTSIDRPYYQLFVDDNKVLYPYEPPITGTNGNNHNNTNYTPNAADVPAACNTTSGVISPMLPTSLVDYQHFAPLKAIQGGTSQNLTGFIGMYYIPFEDQETSAQDCRRFSCTCQT
eukprot:GHVS01062150.1.p2 GENE.GHVS01062150.1~~GHVS01062150.1.p2  ORF type:complete len:126 (+),score=7.92 GHVS01062150.1:581-958(+)